ncbi:MAG: DUF6527 family protein [Thermoanaerobaculia bacterium]
MKHTMLRHAFVEFLPEELAEGTLYVSVEYATAAHKCCCGCGNDVITPLSPNDWKLTFDGRTVSLFPSIGNWSFPCKSHYWIKNNKTEWARRWSDEEIAEIRAGDRGRRERYTDNGPKQPKRGFWATLRKRLTDD